MRMGMDQTEEIRAILDASRFAVLATQRDGQPHTSLVAFTPMDGIHSLVFATYRSTRKFQNLLTSHRVALFIGEAGARRSAAANRCLLTAHGIALEAQGEDREALASAHAKRHPDLAEFLDSPDAALVRVEVGAYQLVSDIADVRWVLVKNTR
jgi:nitroimidazol reductase NimA-like FMN-containing flavoprotein (pyridoxamine 5'-phosphate oxidase superfamily)